MRQPDRTTNIALVGVGNTFRKDDGIGIAIARRLRDRLKSPAGAVTNHQALSIQVGESSGEGADLMGRFEHADRVYLFDAVMTSKAGTQPGTVHRLEASEQHFPSDFFKYSSHAFSLAEAVELARILDRLPPSLIVFGVEAADYGYGEELTPAVDTAGDEVVERVLIELKGLEDGIKNSGVRIQNPE
jgi:hydrogenase maturation protease